MNRLKPYQIAVYFVVLLAVSAPLSADEPKAADEVETGALIARCSVCHTEQGLSGIPGWPSIAGMDKNVIVAKLKGHRAGLVDDSTMKKVAHDLTDQEIDAVAEHFSTLLPAEQ